MNMKTAVRNWLRVHNWDTEITLTFSNDISQSQAHQALKKFWNRVDKRLYGNAVKNYDKRCERMIVMEGDGDLRRVHFHIIANRPTDRFATIIAYCEFLNTQWLMDNRNNYVVTFAPIQDVSRYTNYITKMIQRNNCDALVLDISHLAEN